MKTLDKILLIYSTVVAVGLTLSSLRGDLTAQNLILMALFLPVTIYFIWTLIRLARRRPKTAAAPVGATGFSARRFFSQTHPFFLVTLSLYLALVTAVITRAVLSTMPAVAGP